MDSRVDAVKLAARGYYVFPIPPNQKSASLKNWPSLSNNNPSWINDNWPEPEANIGVHCGPSGLLVIDIDVVGTFYDAMDELTNHVPPQDIPDTFTVQTASGKWHMYYRVPRINTYTNRVKLDGSAIDIRCNNGYVLGPGSTVDGVPYSVVYPDEVAVLPPHLAEWVRPPVRLSAPRRPSLGWTPLQLAKQKRGLLRVITDAPDGELNNRLYWASCCATEMIMLGDWDEDEAVIDLEAAARTAGLEEHRIMPTIRSGLRKGLE